MNNLQAFYQSLQSHPGVPVATLMTFLGVCAGIPDRWIVGFFVMAIIFWPPVIWTAWTHRFDDYGKKQNER